MGLLIFHKRKGVSYMKKTLAFLLCALFLLTSMPLALAQAELADDQTFTFASANDLTTLDVSLMNDEMSGLVMATRVAI